VDIQ
jgi:hypothetical protein